MSTRGSVQFLTLPVLLAALVAGCTADTEPTEEPVEVVVSPPVERSVVNYLDFTGRTQAKESVEVRARIGGYLEKIDFKEGGPVKDGQVLFEIDDRIYKAQRDQSRAEVALADAQVKEADAVYRRNLRLRGSGAISEQEMEQSIRSRTSAMAAAEGARADLKQKQLNVDYCQIIAPITGIADRARVTVGNLVSADTTHATVLTTIVTLEPMYVYFTVDEPTLLRLQAMIREGKMNRPHEHATEVLLGVGGGDSYPFRGTIDFISNKVDPATGTLQVRGSFPNKELILKPGLFARIRLPVGDPHPTLLISETAVGTNQTQRYVYVLNDKNEVTSRSVRLGAMVDGLRIVEEGLKPGERVIINGMLLVRPGLVVKPKSGEMTHIPASAVK
jgi:RND family efflux transporter MFP subunit